MPRPVWKGFISFGLVSIPVSAITVEEQSELHFHLLDSRDKARVRYQRVNENTGKVVPWEKIVKGYEYDKDSYVVLDEKDFENASPEAFKSIDIEEFVALDEIEQLYFDKPYYLLPDSKNKKAYVLLREALKKTHKVGVAKVIIRSREYLSLILPYKNALLLNLIRFEQTLRSEEELQLPDETLKTYKITDREMKMAIDLIKEMTGSWKPEKYHDEYSEALMKWIEKKIKSDAKVKPKKAVSTRRADEVIDFISLLKQSLEKKDKKTTRKKPPISSAKNKTKDQTK